MVAPVGSGVGGGAGSGFGQPLQSQPPGRAGSSGVGSSGVGSSGVGSSGASDQEAGNTPASIGGTAEKNEAKESNWWKKMKHNSSRLTDRLESDQANVSVQVNLGADK
jgi:hypothetical protein